MLTKTPNSQLAPESGSYSLKLITLNAHPLEYLRRWCNHRLHSESLSWVLATRTRRKNLSMVWSTTGLNSIFLYTLFSLLTIRPWGKSIVISTYGGFDIMMLIKSISLSGAVSCNLVTRCWCCITEAPFIVVILILFDGPGHGLKRWRFGQSLTLFLVAQERYTNWILAHQELMWDRFKMLENPPTKMIMSVCKVWYGKYWTSYFC